MKILAIGAHPDDIEFGCAGTLVKYTAKGTGLYLLVVSDGSLGGDPKVRRLEQEASAKIMGAKDLKWGGYKDTFILFDKKLIDLIEDTIKKINPSFIFVNSPEDTHQDHVLLARATIAATRYTTNVLFYETPTSIDFKPLVFVDVSKSLDKKIQCLKAHKSQVPKTNIPDSDIVDIALATARYRGTMGRVTYAEGFYPLRLFINI